MRSARLRALNSMFTRLVLISNGFGVEMAWTGVLGVGGWHNRARSADVLAMAHAAKFNSAARSAACRLARYASLRLPDSAASGSRQTRQERQR